MAKIVVLGAGVMGTALCVPASDNNHTVLLVGTPLDGDAVGSIRHRDGVHPRLDGMLSRNVKAIYSDELRSDHLDEADFIIVGVSSPGVAWATDILNRLLTVPRAVAFVTKGLDIVDSAVSTFAQTVPARVPMMSHFIGIGGPCIARELANRIPTAGIYACQDVSVAERLAAEMATGYYRLSVTADVTGVEACAALKNFFAIGVSAMQTRYPDQKRADGQSKNPAAAAFTQATLEMARLCAKLGGNAATAFGLAGLGDLHVTVGGGRNSRLGHGLGIGRNVADVLSTDLSGETVEGVDTARVLATLAFDQHGAEDEAAEYFPLTSSILEAVLHQRPFTLDFSHLSIR